MAPPPGTKLILSPANKIYLDMKYDDNAVLGLNWAGNVDVRCALRLGSGDAPEGAGVRHPGRRDGHLVRDAGQHPRSRVHAVPALPPWPSSRGPRSRPPLGRLQARLGGQARRWSALGINAYWSPKWTGSGNAVVSKNAIESSKRGPADGRNPAMSRSNHWTVPSAPLRSWRPPIILGWNPKSSNATGVKGWWAQTSTVKKSAAARTPRCVRRNSCQVVRFCRSGAGSIPRCLRMLAMVPRLTW